MILGANSIKKTKKQTFLTKNIVRGDTTGYGFLKQQWLSFNKYFIRTKKIKNIIEKKTDSISKCTI